MIHVDKFLKVPKLNTITIKENGISSPISSKIPRLQSFRISTESLACKTNLTPHTIHEISLKNSSYDEKESFPSEIGIVPGRYRRRHHSDSIQRDKSMDNQKPLSMSSPRSPSPTDDLADNVKRKSTIKRHKSFTGGDKPSLSRFKCTNLNKSFSGSTLISSPIQIVKSCSCGSVSSGLGCETPLSPNFYRCESDEKLSIEHSTSLGCLSCSRNAFTSVVVPEESPLEIKRRCSYSELLKKDGNKPTAKTRSVFDPGRVQVFVRVRPPNGTEDTTKYPLAVSVPDEEQTQLKLFDGKNDRCYQFDGILHGASSNKEVYKTVGEPLLYSALSGFNGILMCYGQTGTGKTYTLMSNDGMSVRIFYQCFKVLNKDKRHKYTVTCSYLQIYQEKIFDLLNATRTIELSLREHPKTGVYIENLTEYVVHSPKEVLDLLKVGKRRLVFAETKMNRASSRSHAICQLKILKERVGNDRANNESNTSPLYIQTSDLEDEDELLYSPDRSVNESYQQMMIDDEDDEDILSHVPELEDGVTSVRGKLYICDLAGSERIKKTKASGERLQEAQHINSSLLELGNVIQALAEGKKSHVPFRNSTLTRLLQEGLSGNCKTRLVVCVAPTTRDVHETKCSLNFGSRAMKIQVTAHVNYEVDYKKLAETLAAKLENLEREWNIQKQNYDKFIKQLKNEIDCRRSISPMDSLINGTKTPAKHVQSLLVVELMTLQLFYNVQRKLTQENNFSEMNVSSDFLFVSPNLDMMLQSMEGLLELLNDYLRDRIPFRSKDYSMSSGCSSVITSPDCIDQSASSTYDVPSTLEPVARFLEHAQIISANMQSNLDKAGDIMAMEQSSKDRLRRVINSLVQMKEMVGKKAISSLKETFDVSFKESKDKLTSLEDIVNHLDGQKDVLTSMDSLDDVQSLENSLYYLLMDKALICCMVLLKTQSNNLFDTCTVPSGEVESNAAELKRMLEELTVERNAHNKAQMELHSLQELQMISAEKIKDIEMELKTIHELRDSLETKLLAVDSKNMILEEQIEKYKKEKESLEARIEEIEKKKLQLETSLKNSDNNNARKERSIVDLKNEKVALESLVSTLKEEITILEKERTRESEEKRRIEEELEDTRDRNIILETEWSCCVEDNGLLETELTALEEDKAILEDELTKYRDDVKMLEEAVTMLEAQASDYKQDITSLKAKEERLLTNVRAEKEKFNKEINSLKQEMSTLRLERRRFQRDISVSRTDKSNTERAYNALKAQKDSIQEDITLFKQEEKRLQREVASLKSERAKLERDTNSLKSENSKLKQDLAQADKIKVELKILQKNEDKIASTFKIEKDRLHDNLSLFKERYDRMEQDLAKVMNEKDKLTKQLKKQEQMINEKSEAANVVRRSQSQPTSAKSQTPDKGGGKMKQCSSVQGALARRSVISGEVSEGDSKVLDLQRRLAFFMAEKEDIQKELVANREKNTNLSSELKTLEADTSKLQSLLTQLTDEKGTLQSKLAKTLESNDVLVKEQLELKKAVSHAQNITKQLRVELEDASEQKRILEVDYMKVKETAKILQGETVLLSTENEHVRKQFQNMDQELKEARSKAQEFSTKLAELKNQVKEANANEAKLNEKVSSLEAVNTNVMGQQEEELLIQHLSGLSDKFESLASTVECLLIPKHDEENQKAVEDVIEEMEKLKEENSILEETVQELKSQLESAILDAEFLKEEREEIERVIDNDDDITKDRDCKKPLSKNIRHLWLQLQKAKKEKTEVQEKLDTAEGQLVTLEEENESLSKSIEEKSLSLEKEKMNYQTHLGKLQQKLEELFKERLHLESEMEFVASQNDELRRGIAVLLEDNSKLAAELDVVEEEFEKQEKELDSATEETKVLLRQLCTAETENLNLCTVQSNHQDDVESSNKKVEKLKKEKEKASEKLAESESKQKTLQDRLLMAELEISKLKSEHASVEGQRKLLVDDLDAADRERSLLKTELHGLARALSPLKKEVNEVIKKQEHLKTEAADTQPKQDISNEVARIRAELCSFNAEKSQLQMEQCELELRLKVVGLEKEDLRIKLRTLIQDLDEQNKSLAKDNGLGITELIQSVSKLVNETQDLELEEKIISEYIDDTNHNNNILNIRLDNSTNELRSAQEQFCLATADRLKLKHKCNGIDKSAMLLSTNNTDQSLPMGQNGDPRKVGISPLQREVGKLKLDIEQFEKSQEDILHEIRSLNDQLNAAENNLVNVFHFKTVIEKNLRGYKERNNKLETHLRVIYNDLVEMESHMETGSGTADVVLQTLDLQKHFQSLEDDLRNTETRNLKGESRNRTLKEEASDLIERCTALQEGMQTNGGVGLWSMIHKK